MSDYLTEQEQLQQLIGWVKKYGLSMGLGMILALVGIWGWHTWQTHQNNKLIQAADAYDAMLTAATQQQTKDMTEQANLLIKQYANTPYAQFASLMLAQTAIQQNHLTDANQPLQWAMTHGTDLPLQSIARLRLARVLLAENKPNEALTLLDQLTDQSFMGLADEIRGDIAQDLNQPKTAQKAYKKALTEIPNTGATPSLLQLKSNEY